MTKFQPEMTDFDGPDEEERRIAERRLFTYSRQAIAAAISVDRVMVNYPAFAEALAAMDRVFQLGRELSVPQGVMVTGNSGTGKTALVRYFLSSLPKSTLFDEGFGAVAIRLYKKPVVGQLVGGLLRRLRYPFPQISAQTLDTKRNVLVDSLRQKGTRLIFVDEAHYLLTQARSHSRTELGSNVTDLLRELMDEVPLALVLLGTQELHGLHAADEHLTNRISAQFQLKGLEAPATWLGFVRAFVKQRASVDLSMLAEPEQAAKLFQATEGNLRTFKRLVTEGVLVAADAGTHTMTGKHLSLAYERVNGKASGKDNPYAS